MQSGRSLLLCSFSYYFLKQLHNCKNQWSCWKKNLKGLGDKVHFLTNNIDSHSFVWGSQTLRTETVQNGLEIIFKALISDQHESCQTLKLKAVKMKLELFNNDDKLKELKVWVKSVVFFHILWALLNGSVAKLQSMLNIAIFDPWQWSLFFRQGTQGKSFC